MPKDKPPLTPEGVQKLIERLDQDLTKVQRSQASPALKQEIQALITALKPLLEKAKPVVKKLKEALQAMEDWGQTIAPTFAELTPRLKQALNLVSSDEGACHYLGGCIVSTSTQCKDLDGSFSNGVDCMDNPLP